MKARYYRKEDFPLIKAWGESFGANYCEDQFPPNGFIVEDVAAVFIYYTQSTVCFLENLISNKNSEKEKREKAIELLIGEAFFEAENAGFKVMYSTTHLPQVITRAIKHGATVKAGQALLTKTLNPSNDG